MTLPELLALAFLLPAAGGVAGIMLDRRDGLRGRQGVAPISPRMGPGEEIDAKPIPLSTLLDALPASITITEHTGDEPLIYVNRAFSTMTGHQPEAVLGHNCRFLQDTGGNQEPRAEIRQALAEGRPVTRELVNVRADGEAFLNRLQIQPLHDSQGRITHHLGVQTDISRERAREREIQWRQAQQMALAATSQAAVEEASFDAVLARCRPTFTRMLGADLIEVARVDPDTGDLWQEIHSEEGKPSLAIPCDRDSQAGRTLERMETILSDDLNTDGRFHPSSRLLEQGIRSGVTILILDRGRAWGVLCVYSVRIAFYKEPDADFLQSISYLLGSAVTRFEQSTSMVRAARLQDAILDGTVDAVLTVDGEGRILDANRAMVELLGTRKEDLRGRPLDEMPIRTPDERQQLRGGLNSHLDALGRPGARFDLIPAVRGPVPIWLSTTTTRLDGMPYRVLTIRDLRHEQELQEELVHAQKIESVGHLTGGVAHDFNNLLTVITGNADMLDQATSEERPDLIAGIQAAARRGADLTGRLLAFARKQPLRPARTDVADVLTSAMPMIERLIGERYRVDTDIAEDLPPIHVDAAQLDAAILNLVVNARDAMPQGGRIDIAALPVERCGQQHVLIEVRDNGPGVPAALRNQIFDPFFTTKETGSGTGLGLSMVHGFVRQSGGTLSLSDNQPSGAVFELGFPALERPGSREPEPEARSEALDHRALRVLIVEDDDMVRALAARTLRTLGHVTVEASDPERALEVLEQDPEIELLFTDMVLASELSGLDLAHQTMQMRSQLPVVITSGYTQYGDDISTLPDRILFLPKPYTMDQVRTCFRRAMALSG